MPYIGLRDNHHPAPQFQAFSRVVFLIQVYTFYLLEISWIPTFFADTCI